MVGAIILALLAVVFYHYYRYSLLLAAIKQEPVTTSQQAMLYTIGLTTVALGTATVIEIGRAVVMVLK